MLIVLDKPAIIGNESTFAVNTEAYQMFLIRQKTNGFELALKTFFDGYFSNRSAIYFGIYTFDSTDKCQHLLQAIIKAKKSGETVFDLSDYLKKQKPVSDALKSDNIPTA